MWQVSIGEKIHYITLLFLDCFIQATSWQEAYCLRLFWGPENRKQSLVREYGDTRPQCLVGNGHGSQPWRRGKTDSDPLRSWNSRSSRYRGHGGKWSCPLQWGMSHFTCESLQRLSTTSPWLVNCSASRASSLPWVACSWAGLKALNPGQWITEFLHLPPFHRVA
jgi:hypothetical protein